MVILISIMFVFGPSEDRMSFFHPITFKLILVFNTGCASDAIRTYFCLSLASTYLIHPPATYNPVELLWISNNSTNPALPQALIIAPTLTNRLQLLPQILAMEHLLPDKCRITMITLLTVPSKSIE